MTLSVVSAAFALGVSALDLTVVALILITAATRGPVRRVRSLAWIFFAAVALIGFGVSAFALHIWPGTGLSLRVQPDSVGTRPGLWVIHLLIAVVLVVTAVTGWLTAPRVAELVASAEDGPAPVPTPRRSESPGEREVLREADNGAEPVGVGAAAPSVIELLVTLGIQGQASLQKVAYWVTGKLWVTIAVPVMLAILVLLDPPFWAALTLTSSASILGNVAIWLAFAAGVSCCSLILALAMLIGGESSYRASAKFLRRHVEGLLRIGAVVALGAAIYLVVNVLMH